MNRKNMEPKYDDLQTMLREIGRFNDSYRSFTTGKEYTDLLGQTASGLLKDVAAKTEELTSEDKARHKVSLEVFAAFCMYFCADRIRNSRLEKKSDRAGDVVNTVYQRILKRVRKDLESGTPLHYVRVLIRCSAQNAMYDIIRDENRHSFSESCEEEAASMPRAEICRALVDGAADAIRKHRELYLVERAIAKMAKRKLLTEEDIFSICSFYNLGDGFEKLGNQDIAKKFGISDAKASKLRKKAVEKLADFIKTDPELKEELC